MPTTTTAVNPVRGSAAPAKPRRNLATRSAKSASAVSGDKRPPRIKRSDLLAPGQLPAEGFATQREILCVLPFSASTLRTLIKEGKFAAPIWLSKRTKVWPVEIIRAEIEKLKASAATN